MRTVSKPTELVDCHNTIMRLSLVFSVGLFTQPANVLLQLLQFDGSRRSEINISCLLACSNFFAVYKEYRCINILCIYLCENNRLIN